MVWFPDLAFPVLVLQATDAGVRQVWEQCSIVARPKHVSPVKYGLAYQVKLLVLRVCSKDIL